LQINEIDINHILFCGLFGIYENLCGILIKSNIVKAAMNIFIAAFFERNKNYGEHKVIWQKFFCWFIYTYLSHIYHIYFSITFYNGNHIKRRPIMIKVEHLTKCYGDFKAVDDLSFEIEDGHVYGFLGPNGAGKSTTMNIMTGCLSATDGHVKIDDYDIFEEAGKAKKLIGYLPEQPPLYMNETPAEYLRFVGEAKGLKGAELERQITEVMEQTRISEMRNRRISALSKGYKQRVGIAQALIGNPKIIILDEPTVGLDPIQIIEIRDLIRQLGENHTVILSSHILSEVQTICEKILIIAHGKLIAFDEPENLENRLCSPNEITFTAEADSTEIQEILSGVEHLTAVELEEKEDGVTQVKVKTDYDNIYDISRELFFAFAEKKKALLEINLKKASLEDIFIELTDTTEKTDDTVPVGEIEKNDIEDSLTGENPTEENNTEASNTEMEVDAE
jgi:ABC-2 type transport system ATP-binding protein